MVRRGSMVWCIRIRGTAGMAGLKKAAVRKG
jgi:hypothetical protein